MILWKFLSCSLFIIHTLAKPLSHGDESVQTSSRVEHITAPRRTLISPRVEQDVERGVMNMDNPNLERSRSNLIQRIKQYPNFVEHLNAAVAEFLGTVLFLFLAFAPVSYINNHVQDPASALIYNSLAFGFALAIAARCFATGFFNAGLSLSMLILNYITPMRAIILIIADYTGAMTAAAIVQLLTGQLNAVTRKSDEINVAQAVVLEALATSTFLFSVLMLVAKKKSPSMIANLEVGLSLFIHEMVTIGFSGGSLNSNRGLSTDIAQNDFVRYSWIYQIGPLAGGVLAAGWYRTIELLQSLREEIPDVPMGPELSTYTHQEREALTEGTRDHILHNRVDQHPENAESRHRPKRSDRVKLTMTGQNQPLSEERRENLVENVEPRRNFQT